MSREELASVASVAHKVGRTSDMLEAVHMMAEKYSPLNPEEEQLILAAYKRLFPVKYYELRTIVEEQDSGKPAAFVGLKGYLEVRKDDMERTCKKVLNIVQHHLLPYCSGEEKVVLYTKMEGDINWLLAIVSKVEDKELYVESTLTAYETASKAAQSLSAAHPLRLDVNLTKTAFFSDVMGWHERAIALAKLELDKAGRELASLDEESNRKSAEIMGLMEDNLKLWKNPSSLQSEEYSESEDNTISSSLVSQSLGGAGPSYTNGSPSPPPAPPSPPVVPPRFAGPPVPPAEFVSPNDFGYEFHEGLSPMQIRYRKKAAQIKKGRMG